MNTFVLGKVNSSDLEVNLSMCNRHGLVAGASGTGKTTTMKALAAGFSKNGVPCFFQDVKGDLTSVAKNYPVHFWDIFGEKGHPVRVTISGMGPTLLSRLLGLTDAQQGVLNVVFRVADEHGLLLLDLKDLRAMLSYVAENAKEFSALYGNISSASVGVIQRSLLAFEEEGGSDLFGEPALDIKDWMRTDSNGRGYINILESSRLIQSPTVYATFLLWLLSELFEQLPEVGDLDKPRMVFFFDEAHLLFDDAPKALVQKIEQVVKLIRSKGVGVFFVTQAPSDIPDSVLSQLSNRIEHALRAYTPSEQKVIKAAADSFRANPAFDTAEALVNLGVGEALVSMLDKKGIPSVVEKVKILCPDDLLKVEISESEVNKIILSSEFDLKYKTPIDRESAFEILEKAKKELQIAQEKQPEEKEITKTKKTEKTTKKSSYQKKGVVEKAISNASSSVARSISTNMINTMLGGSKSSSKTIAKRAASNALSSVMRSCTNDLVRGLFGTLK